MENKLQSIGYCRTSTKRQSLDTQIYLLKENGVPDDLIFMDEGIPGR